MFRLVHPLAGLLALAIICLFWTATVTVELLGTSAQVAAVKGAIPWGFLILIPALIAIGGSGERLARDRRGRLLSTKQRRMKVIAANGLLVLVPCALWLAASAAQARFDSLFVAVQGLELLAGGLNIALLSLNFRDGLRMTRRWPAK
ncbi:hypothetical protein [Aurantiacibacter suaedae]|uniref:hypothetical protein n=1 Tax=Aurantiacibacter suaedae TaxID=2545755 RepID=UPI0010F65AB0|nr:hypothetical protein [Aurantiacibacter suaedae]